MDFSLRPDALPYFSASKKKRKKGQELKLRKKPLRNHQNPNQKNPRKSMRCAHLPTLERPGDLPGDFSSLPPSPPDASLVFCTTCDFFFITLHSKSCPKKRPQKMTVGRRVFSCLFTQQIPTKNIGNPRGVQPGTDKKISGQNRRRMASKGRLIRQLVKKPPQLCHS